MIAHTRLGFVSRQLSISKNVRPYATALPRARLNTPIDYASHPLLHHSSKSLTRDAQYPASSTSQRLNLYQAVNSALRHALQDDESSVIFGEDVSFGGVFRCTMGLAADFGSERVFNTPLTEQGIVGFAVGAAAQGLTAIAEVQFADYMYPAFDQIVNEAAKWRYREGKTGGNVGGLVIRMPCGVVGHGALYHSQSPEALLTHIPGLRVVLPRSPAQAKGLLLGAIACEDPVIFMEPKLLYRAAIEHVPDESYQIPLSTAEILKEGSDITVISYGHPLYLCQSAISKAEEDLGVSVELIDLRTIYPWDRECILRSVRKTGRVVLVHEAMVNAGVGAEIAASIQKEAFLSLEAPIERVGGFATHTPLIFEKFNIPDVARIYDAVKRTIEF